MADPGAGMLKYTREEFCHCWLSTQIDGEDIGVALLLEPTPKFYIQEDEVKAVSKKDLDFFTHIYGPIGN